MSAAITTRRGFSRTGAAFAAGLFSKLSPATAVSLMHNHYYKGPITDHFDRSRFFNPNYPDTDRSFTDILRGRLTERAAAWPRSIPVQQTVPPVEVTGLRATIVGHASVLIQSGGLNVFDRSFWSEKASPVTFAGPRRVSAPGIAFETSPRFTRSCSATIITTIWTCRLCAVSTPGIAP
jgi:hypothetical protein